MPQAALTTVAQLLYAETPNLNFARLVSDLEAVLARFPDNQVRLNWDHEDVAIFDMPGLRILLGWCHDPGQGLAGCLTLSTGPSPLTARPGSRQRHDSICSRLVERVQMRLQPTALMWRQIEGVIGSDTLDLLVETLPGLPDCVGAGPPLELSEPPFAANDRLRQVPSGDPVLARLREALYGQEESDGTRPQGAQMRLAIHAMNATLIVVWAPLGAAVMTYTILRGEDLRLSSRLMLLGGSISALAQTGLGAQMAAMAGV
jgi:hypothetical protein